MLPFFENLKKNSEFAIDLCNLNPTVNSEQINPEVHSNEQLAGVTKNLVEKFDKVPISS